MMINAFQKIKRFLKQLRAYAPSQLPVGMTEFDAFVSRLMANHQLPTTSRDSIGFTLATAIMHLGPTEDRKPDMYFVRLIRASAAKQISGAAFTRIKEAQKALQQKPVEATTLSVVAPNVQSVQN